MNRYSQIPQPEIARNNSLNGAGAAAAAAMLRSQGSTPKPIARTSSLRNSDNRNTRNPRTNSLKTYSYTPTPSYQPHTTAKRHNSLTHRPAAVLEEEDDDDYIITTKTTKVVDSQGRTQSITTKTIKTLADGSNIIETTTKNISRSNSRNNSLRSNSILNNNNNNNNLVNLTKIEEDLQDFDYNYMEDNLHLNDGPIQHNSRSPEKYKSNNNSNGLDTAFTPAVSSNLNPNPRNDRLNSINSTTSSQKPLRSILKSTPRPKYDEGSFDSSPTNHPYQNIVSSPNDNASIASSQIKFNNQVETIPIEARKIKKKPQVVAQAQKPKQTSSTPDADFYAAAMQAAYKKVYGDRDPSQQPQIGEIANPASPKASSKPFSNPKVDKVTQAVLKVDDQGITNKNYSYENHHKSFIGLSLRDKEIPKGKTHHQRVKSDQSVLNDVEKKDNKAEKRAKKELEAQEKQARKDAEAREKQARKDAKLQEKEAKKQQRSGKFGGLFNRRKSVDSQRSTVPSNTDVLARKETAEVEIPDNNQRFIKLNNSIPETPEPKFEAPLSSNKQTTPEIKSEQIVQQPVIVSGEPLDAHIQTSPSSFNRDEKVKNSPERPLGHVFDHRDDLASLINKVDEEFVQKDDLNYLPETANAGHSSRNGFAVSEVPVLDSKLSSNLPNPSVESNVQRTPVLQPPPIHQDASPLERDAENATVLPSPSIEQGSDYSVSPSAFIKKDSLVAPVSPAAFIKKDSISSSTNSLKSPQVIRDVENSDTLYSPISRDSDNFVDSNPGPGYQYTAPNNSQLPFPEVAVDIEIDTEPKSIHADTSNYDADDSIINAYARDSMHFGDQLLPKGISEDSIGRLSAFHDASSYPDLSTHKEVEDESSDFTGIVAKRQQRENTVDGVNSYSNDLTGMSKHSSVSEIPEIANPIHNNNIIAPSTPTDKKTSLSPRSSSNSTFQNSASFQTPRSQVPTLPPPNLERTVPVSPLVVETKPTLDPRGSYGPSNLETIEPVLLQGVASADISSSVEIVSVVDPAIQQQQQIQPQQEVTPVQVETSKPKKSKAKKGGKFKKAIYKYFVNSYD